MLRSRLLLLFAIFASAGCHSGGDAQSPSSRAETTSADSNASPEHDVRTALNAASPGLRKCRAEGGPSTVDARVTFEPSGKASKIDVAPASEPVASCVKKKLADVSVLPFRGEPITMTTMVRF